MKTFWLILAGFTLLTPTTSHASSSDLDALKACVDEVKESRLRLLARLPTEIFTADRKLFHMAKAIPFLEENARTLELRGTANGPLNSILVANAIEGCHRFARQFTSRSLLFQWFLVNILLLMALLTLRMVLFMVPGRNSRGITNAENSKSPTSDRDRPPSDNPPGPLSRVG